MTVYDFANGGVRILSVDCLAAVVGWSSGEVDDWDYSSDEGSSGAMDGGVRVSTFLFSTKSKLQCKLIISKP